MAEALGWPNKPVGWGDMLALINDPQGWGKFGHPEWGRFSWGHTDPEISTSALSTLLAEFYAAVGKQRDLTVADVQNRREQPVISPRPGAKQSSTTATTPWSSATIWQKYGMSLYLRLPDGRNHPYRLQQKRPPGAAGRDLPDGRHLHPRRPLHRDGERTSAEQKQAADEFYKFLLTAESQKLAMNFGFRPANIDVPLSDPVSPAFGVQPQGPQNTLPIPSAEVIVAAKQTWSQNRKRADIGAGSRCIWLMQDNGKLDQAKAGLETFLQRILPEDRVGLGDLLQRRADQLPRAPLAENRTKLSDVIQSLRPNGKTAIYDGLIAGKQALDQIPADQEERIKAIVLLDGRRGERQQQQPLTN